MREMHYSHCQVISIKYIVLQVFPEGETSPLPFSSTQAIIFPKKGTGSSVSQKLPFTPQKQTTSLDIDVHHEEEKGR